MSAKHTPGPWIVEHDSFGTVIRGAEVEREEHGTKYGFRDYVGSTWGHRTSTSDANALLMATAPELLAELEKVEKLLLAISATDYPVSDELASVQAVVAKATGSAS